MTGIGLMICLAVIVEALIEYGKSIYGMFEAKDYKTGATQLVSIALGVGLAFAVGLRAFAALSIALPPALDTALTGIVLSRGSNYVSDLVGKLTATKQ